MNGPPPVNGGPPAVRARRVGPPPVTQNVFHKSVSRKLEPPPVNAGATTDNEGSLLVNGGTEGPPPVFTSTRSRVSSMASISRSSMSSNRKVTIGGTFDTNGEIEYSALEIEEKIGGGNYGDVFRGRLWGTEVAIKQLHTTDEHSTLSHDLKHETEILSQLRHPNTLLYIGACTTPPCVVTEFARRGSLTDILQDESFVMTSQKLLDFALMVAQGMSYLHSHKPQVIHRDLKPDNIMVDHNNIMKIGDFGLSAMKVKRLEKHSTKNLTSRSSADSLSSIPEVSQEPSQASQASQNNSPASQASHASQTAQILDEIGVGMSGDKARDESPKQEIRERSVQGSVSMTTGVGTPLYMAPELLCGDAYDHKVDVWGFGIVLAELVTRKRPYSGLRLYEIRKIREYLVAGKKPYIPPWVPQALRDIMLACLADKPADRPSFPELVGWLRRLMLEPLGHVDVARITYFLEGAECDYGDEAGVFQSWACREIVNDPSAVCDLEPAAFSEVLLKIAALVSLDNEEELNSVACQALDTLLKCARGEGGQGSDRFKLSTLSMIDATSSQTMASTPIGLGRCRRLLFQNKGTLFQSLIKILIAEKHTKGVAVLPQHHVEDGLLKEATLTPEAGKDLIFKLTKQLTQKLSVEKKHKFTSYKSNPDSKGDGLSRSSGDNVTPDNKKSYDFSKSKTLTLSTPIFDDDEKVAEPPKKHMRAMTQPHIRLRLEPEKCSEMDSFLIQTLTPLQATATKVLLVLLEGATGAVLYDLSSEERDMVDKVLSRRTLLISQHAAQIRLQLQHNRDLIMRVRAETRNSVAPRN